MKNNLNVKSKLKLVWSLLCIILIIQFLINYFLKLSIVIFNINGSFIRLILVLLLLLIPVFCINYKSMRKKYIILSILISSIIIFIYLFNYSGNRYFYFYSPTKYTRKILIAEETSFLLGGSTNFYERKYFIFAKTINGHIITDDGYRPFSNNSVNIKWLDENTVQLEYEFNSHGIIKKTIIKFR